MIQDSVVTWDKATIVPLHHVSWDYQVGGAPYVIRDSVTIEDVRGILTPSHFSLWNEYPHNRRVGRSTAYPARLTTTV